MVSTDCRAFGRTITHEGVLYLGYSASGVSFITSSNEVYAIINGVPEPKGICEPAYLGVFVNDGTEPISRIKVRHGQHRYKVFEQNAKEEVSIDIVKLSEALYDKVGIAGIEAGDSIRPTESKKRKLLFIGDSISAGFGIGGRNGEVFTTAYEDATKAYPYLVSKELNAEYEIIAWSGGGVISRWVTEDQNGPDTSYLMPDIFPYEDISLEETVIGTRHIRHNFRTFIPDMITVNLGTNDDSYCRNIPSRNEQFRTEYCKFLNSLHDYYPGIPVLVVYGLFETNLNEMVSQAAKESKCEFLRLDMMTENDDLCVAGHPGAMVQRNSAEAVAGVIRKNMALGNQIDER